MLKRTISQLTPQVTLIRSKKSNAYLVGKGKDKLLVDCGDISDQGFTDALLKTMMARDDRLSAVVLTHAHRGHVGGLTELRRVFPSLSVYRGEQDTTSKARERFLWADTLLTHHTQRIVTEDNDTALRVLATPGHTADSLCFHLEAEDSIFTGDTIYTDPHAIWRLDSPSDYLATLQVFRKTYPRIGYPGHGDVILDVQATVTQALEAHARLVQGIMETIQSQAGLMDTREIIDAMQDRELSDSDYEHFGHYILSLLLKLEQQGKLQKRSMPSSVHRQEEASNDPNTIKGPGGLTMSQISDLVHKSVQRDVDRYGIKPSSPSPSPSSSPSLFTSTSISPSPQSSLTSHLNVVWSPTNT